MSPIINLALPAPPLNPAPAPKQAHGQRDMTAQMPPCVTGTAWLGARQLILQHEDTDLGSHKTACSKLPNATISRWKCPDPSRPWSLVSVSLPLLPVAVAEPCPGLGDRAHPPSPPSCRPGREALLQLRCIHPYPGLTQTELIKSTLKSSRPQSRRLLLLKLGGRAAVFPQFL